MPRTAALPRPRPRVSLLRPSATSLAVGLGSIAIAAGLYGAGRQTSAFAVTHLDVVGAPPAIRHQVKDTAAAVRGTSLLALDGDALRRSLAALPSVVDVGYDRAFPHTLRLVVVPEQPVAVVRQGSKAWVVSARGRVVKPVKAHDAKRLPRVWIPRTTPVAVGGFLPANHATAIARSLALASRFPAHVAGASLKRDGLLFRLRSGLELRLGEPTDVRLKLAVARLALRRLPAGATYLDVSVPGRPVSGNSQVSGRD